MSVGVMFIDNLAAGGGFRYERVLHESILWITYSENGENSLKTRVVGNSARKRNGTYFFLTANPPLAS